MQRFQDEERNDIDPKAVVVSFSTSYSSPIENSTNNHSSTSTTSSSSSQQGDIELNTIDPTDPTGDEILRTETNDSGLWAKIKRLWTNDTARSYLIAGILMSLVICIIIFILIIGCSQESSISSLPVYSYKTAAVSTDSEQCSQMATETLKNGGNAIDAAVIACLCVGIQNPIGTGIGGGGIALVRFDGKFYTFDFREAAPANAKADMYSGNVKEQYIGPKAAGIPGEIKGLAEMHSKFGKLPWVDLVKPIANLARNFTISKYIAESLEKMKQKGVLPASIEQIFSQNGQLLKEGETCSRPILADTLDAIAIDANSFYNGDISVKLINDIIAAGGIWKKDDLKSYNVLQREIIETYFLGYKLYTVSAPFGGPALTMILNIIEQFNFGVRGNASTLNAHYLTEAYKFAFGSVMQLGDPLYSNVNKTISDMLSKDVAATLRARIKDETILPFNQYFYNEPEIAQLKEAGTSHMSIVDASGNIVSLTSTINTPFGSSWVSPSTGILLNNEMGDFTLPNSAPPPYKTSEANLIAPHKRPLSSMAPVIVLKNGELFLVTGGSGGKTIISAIAHVLINVLAYNKPIVESTFNPRWHHQLYPFILGCETETSNTIVDSLVQKGNNVTLYQRQNAVNSILFYNSSIYAASDYVKFGKPSGY
eukprot:TRINITY_DN1749_c0_g5_i1.p1 TRINITY_DN1749_c0_g5~~TRINITY_DN1749_c0_g5_i1.p1  ORF type:complete len:653 (-),score=288.99 TRINITY_DN1749_c0_g5_i1:98-2056(-)